MATEASAEGDFPDVSRVDVSSEAMNAFSTEEEFLQLAFSLMVEVTSYVSIAACTMGPTWDREHAAVGGNMVRLFKLLDTLLDQTAKRRQEVSLIVSRLIFECTVNIRYLIDRFSTETVDAYISYSFRHERRLYGLIKDNIGERGGLVLPIEDRMLKSIERSARVSDISLDEVVPFAKGPWPDNLFERSKMVGLEKIYLGAFGGPSHAVHGNWQDIYANNLDWNEENQSFTPRLEWKRPRPQVLSSLALIVIETVGIYCSFAGVGSRLAPSLRDLTDRVLRYVDGHENYLGEKQWPKI
jgi:uncharacterized protein DUF5677